MEGDDGSNTSSFLLLAVESVMRKPTPSPSFAGLKRSASQSFDNLFQVANEDYLEGIQTASPQQNLEDRNTMIALALSAFEAVKVSRHFSK